MLTDARAVTVRPMVGADAEPVLAIYQAGLDTGQASFETTAPDWDRFDATHLPEHRHVALAAGEVAGWVAVSAVSIFPDNTASLALHAACGFRTIGMREHIARHHDRWRDTLLLERRSPTIT
ncbi:hypothetical protein AB0I55_12235 [Actinocatenispora sera]|uniref:GNAT family N-acetyltransferase n=1 Tax=Actinocatenispora sera TaxID=390989 RepID=UPI0033CA713C